jgi:hypothetical protein
MVAVLRVLARVPGAGGEVTAPLPGSGVDKIQASILESIVISIGKACSAADYALSAMPGVALQLAGLAGHAKRQGPRRR